MKKYSFTKMSGAGNDFVVFDLKETPEIDCSPVFIQTVCDRRNGIGADGVLVIGNKPGFNYSMEYFNSDGSTGALCGNGARCSIMFAEKTGRLMAGKASFWSNNNTYLGETLDSENVKFFLNPPCRILPNIKINAAGQTIKAAFIDTGCPHIVIRLEDILKNPQNPGSYYNGLDELPVFELGREIRYHADFAPLGANVNFITIRNNKIYIRTYERGVEDETLACGTGSVASAAISFLKYGVEPPVSLITKSGKELIVDFIKEQNVIKNVSLTGPAVVTFKGEFFY